MTSDLLYIKTDIYCLLLSELLVIQTRNMERGVDKQSKQVLHKNFDSISQENQFATEAHYTLLDKKNKRQSNMSSFQIQKVKAESQKHSKKPKYLEDESYESAADKCYPKCLTCIGQWVSPCLVLCPGCRCGSCCGNTPLFQQRMDSFGILQRWGSFQQILEPGLHVINPISQKCIEVNRQTRTLEFRQTAFSKDNVQFQVESVIFYRVIDSLSLIYKLGTSQQECRQCVVQIAQACLRNLIGINTLQEVIQNRQTISKDLRFDLNENLKIWGIYIETVSLKEIILSKQIRASLQSVTKAKRQMQAQIINYQAQVEIGKLVKQVSEILSTKAAFQIRYLDMIGNIIKNGAQNVIMIKTQLEEKE